jgi:hypothetical protein
MKIYEVLKALDERKVVYNTSYRKYYKMIDVDWRDYPLMLEKEKFVKNWYESDICKNLNVLFPLELDDHSTWEMAENVD